MHYVSNEGRVDEGEGPGVGGNLITTGGQEMQRVGKNALVESHRRRKIKLGERL